MEIDLEHHANQDLGPMLYNLKDVIWTVHEFI